MPLNGRSGMRMLVERMKSSSPRPRSPRMYNEEAIREAQYPDGRDPGEMQNGHGTERPIERDDFPAPPFAFGPSRRRHHSEPGSSMRSGGSYESTPVISSDEEEEEDEAETVDEKLQRTEEVLQKMAASQGMMGKVFLQEIEVEKQRRKAAKHKRLDPRSAARTPAAKKEPHFRLRYDNPVNASPSRVADHLKPWDDDVLFESSLSRPRSAVTPFLPGQTPVQHRERATSPSNVIRPGYEGRAARTLPPRFSPGFDISDAGVGAYSAEFSSNRSEDGLGSSSLGHRSPLMQQNIRVSSTYTQGLQAATPRSGSGGGVGGGYETSGTDDLDHSMPDMLQASNIYPLHLLFTTNYRLPGDVDRCNLEKHLSDADFDMVFRLSREDFYRLPYWKRCDLKRKYHLF